MTTDDPASGPPILAAAQREAFARDGWTVVRNLLSPAECDALELVTMALLRREIPVPGRDYCDMTADYGRPIEEHALLNVMLPRRHHAPLRGDAYERRAAAVAAQLCGPDLVLDYDQIVAKPPRSPDAIFHWHQDLAYWPLTADTRTASFWLALDEVDEDNGCVRFVDGSHREPALRPHHPLHGDRDTNHTLVAALDPSRDRPRPARLHRGDASVHHERTLHGSGGNTSDRWRRGFVIAFRAASAVAEERALGFTHSHNDAPDVLERVAALRPR
ncbi:MAG TPA: phytanoyl-CoA dioxygenase family protein [Planctomycetota bacterium]|nr:phytanoyl-CoA dioxygenase family protein [Planctomycetota bacterium]